MQLPNIPISPFCRHDTDRLNRAAAERITSNGSRRMCRCQVPFPCVSAGVSARVTMVPQLCVTMPELKCDGSQFQC